MPGPALAADDAAAAATSWIDKFNDPAAFKAGHAPNPVIVDEFPPFLWSGADAPESWLADLAKYSAATGISGVHFDHAAPAQAQSNGDSAYVMVPVILRVQAGNKTLSAAGQIALVMTRTENGWKIASWTYSASPPKPDR
jgi:hypothetical protein